ncbi:MAG: NAD(P)H-hydrate dehydratase [Flavobacteriales bacterium]|nr:NAD(P)H-hydrate dehydratase [Flavobacteriales bacterium]
MLPLLSAPQVRLADGHTIAHEPIASIDLMERAARNCTHRLQETLGVERPVVVLAGMGNNGGDGLAMARMLHLAGQHVQVLVPRYKQQGSPDFEVNLARAEASKVHIACIAEGSTLPEFDSRALVVDALFGTGLQKPLAGWLKTLVMQVNALPNEVLAIDLPSGLFADDNSANDPEAIVKADRTFTLELPKLALLLPDQAGYCGKWEVVPIGLDKAFVASLNARLAVLEISDVSALMPDRGRTAHKGDFGHAWLLAGGPGKMGAAIMAARACLRTGCGLLTVHVPAGQAMVMNAVVPEAMASMDAEICLSGFPKIKKAAAIGVGPGIGTADETVRLLKLLVQEAPAPLVLDADALNILSENKTWLAFLPPATILTPHPGELERLTGIAGSSHDRLMQAKELAVKHRSVVVLKGANSAVCSPDGRIFFNSTGNAGMAKGGSGDVLTGIITGLRAQGLDALPAALLGVYAHGLAGDLAAKKLGMDGMLPSDLIAHLPQAWMQLRAWGN